MLPFSINSAYANPSAIEEEEVVVVVVKKPRDSLKDPSET